ncbi:hypothetical protein M5689_005843 [Euphorbia peplus]|nr:hypothetical protein M5689_005843 [Euphorbia peplus]
MVFAALKDRVKRRIQGLEERTLSAGGKEVMIKAVIQAIPQYIMSIFLLPDSLCQEIQGLISKFWWGGTDKKRPMYWLA